MSQPNLSEATFHIPADRRRRLTSFVLGFVNREAPLRILDIGCSTGEQLLDFAEDMPHAALTGVDISAPSIERAGQALEARPFSGRVRFVARDYMALHDEPFDLVFSWSTLHLIDASDEGLFGKIASDLAPGGLLINIMPFDCLYNRFLINLRRLFRAAPRGALDSLLVALGKAVYGRTMSEDQLRERALYMRVLPERLHDDSLCRLLRGSFGMALVHEEDEPHSSPFQLKHRIAVFRKL